MPDLPRQPLNGPPPQLPVDLTLDPDAQLAVLQFEHGFMALYPTGCRQLAAVLLRAADDLERAHAGL